MTVDFEETPSAHDGTSAFTLRLAFSEAVDIDGDGLLSALTVGGGTATAAQQVDGRADLWELTVEPSGNAAVSILVPVRACTETGAICTEDDRALAVEGAIFIPYRAGGPDLTAEWVKSPSAHSGSGRAFTARVEFSEPVTTSANNFRNHALTVGSHAETLSNGDAADDGPGLA